MGLAKSGNLLEILCNSTSPLQFPLCKVFKFTDLNKYIYFFNIKKCSSTLSIELKKQLNDLELECVNYKQALNQLTTKHPDLMFDQESSNRKLEELKVNKIFYNFIFKYCKV